MSVATAEKQQHSFQTEVKQLLKLMINSLYSNKEIFLRELVSNSSDALDKLRFKALSDATLYEKDNQLGIEVSFDKDSNSITIKDNGIGMNQEDIINNLGTIAKSGTKDFFSKLTGDQAKDSQLIGQFGVGFYSSFIVADKVSVESRKAGEAANMGVRWESSGDGEYTIEAIEKDNRGTEVTLYLKEDAKEFLNDWRLRNIITTYADHLSFPVTMLKMAEMDKDGKEKPVNETEVVNKATALWMRNKKEIKDEEYQEFYKHLSKDTDEALAWSHNRVEGKYEYTNLLYIPKKAPFDLWNRERRYGVKLYVQRVFIMDDAEQFMPSYLRFTRGLIDSNDLPLNISREILQNNRVVESIKSASVKKVLGMLEKLSENTEQYTMFWEQFGEVLKEGPAEDFANKEQIAKLLRFATTHTADEKQTVSFADYIGRMQEGQEKIYYITADSYRAAKSSPNLEIFKEKGIEVLLLSDKVDEWLVSHLTEFDKKQLQSVSKGALDLGKLDKDQEKKAEEAKKEFKDLVKNISDVLEGKVKEVRVTTRLTNSPACIVADEQDVGLQMQRILKAAGQAVPDSKPIFEINAEHTILKRLNTMDDKKRFADWTHLLFDQATLAEGGQLKDPAEFASRLNQLFVDLSA